MRLRDIDFAKTLREMPRRHRRALAATFARAILLAHGIDPDGLFTNADRGATVTSRDDGYFGRTEVRTYSPRKLQSRTRA